jgi:FAD/FMN-containing dehydrogenase
MSKVAQYLNEHLAGEITINDSIRRHYSTDGSILTLSPDMVAYPRLTTDIRKITRFCWQLAEKGHSLSITPRGGGCDKTGGAIGTGIVMDMSIHMNEIFELDSKQRLVRVQPGLRASALNEALRLHGLYIPSLLGVPANSTIGGLIATNSGGYLSGKYGYIGSWVHQLEVVLANGEILQTGKVSKRELQKKKGLQTFEGEVYRSIDNLLTDKAGLVETINPDVRDNVGYNIADVKYKDGSLDLMPLFVGSQGTLGVISEIILKVEPVPEQPLGVAIAFSSYDSARDALDFLRQLDPSRLDLIDGRLFAAASEQGRRYPFVTEAQDQGEVSAVIYAEFDASKHTKKKSAKKIAKYFEQNPAFVVMERTADAVGQLRLLSLVTNFTQVSTKPTVSAPPLFDGIYIPSDRFEDFTSAVSALEQKHHIDLPLSGFAAQHVYFTYPLFDFHKPVDRQKMFKLLADWSAAVAAHGGHLIGDAGEGRLKVPFAYKDIADDIKEIYKEVRTLFDPLTILNAGVKQETDLKKIAESVNTGYAAGDSPFRYSR